MHVIGFWCFWKTLFKSCRQIRAPPGTSSIYLHLLANLQLVLTEGKCQANYKQFNYKDLHVCIIPYNQFSVAL